MVTCAPPTDGKGLTISANLKSCEGYRLEKLGIFFAENLLEIENDVPRHEQASPDHLSAGNQVKSMRVCEKRNIDPSSHRLAVVASRTRRKRMM